MVETRSKSSSLQQCSTPTPEISRENLVTGSDTAKSRSLVTVRFRSCQEPVKTVVVNHWELQCDIVQVELGWKEVNSNGSEYGG